MCRAQTLHLEINQIGDAGVTALANACAGGGMANVTFLDLSVNQIGDNDMAAFAQAIKPTSEGGSGAMAQLQARSLPTALSLIRETLHVHSPDSDDLYGVQYADT